MKKGKVFSKGHVTVAVMLLALGAAVWLNAKYLPSSSKYLGEASYVNTTEDKNAVQTGAKAEDDDYFASAQKERTKASLSNSWKPIFAAHCRKKKFSPLGGACGCASITIWMMWWKNSKPYLAFIP